VEEAAERLAAARATGLDVAVDFHGRVHRAMAKRLARALEPHAPLFLEEPVLPEHPEALREIARATSIPIACGERLYTRWGFKDVLASGVVDVIQPDLSHAGGLLETRKIAAMAEAFDVAVAPHCPLGPVALAASLQLDACTPNVVIQEQSLKIHYNERADLLDYVRDASVFAVRDGHMAVPDGPGLGVEIDEERVRAAAGAEPWHSPVWRNDDGTVAEW
jgi:galactonate dehydratase